MARTNYKNLIFRMTLALFSWKAKELGMDTTKITKLNLQPFSRTAFLAPKEINNHLNGSKSSELMQKIIVPQY